MAGIARLGNIGISVRDLNKMVDFYTRVLGMTVTDADETGSRRVYLSAKPEAEHHEIVFEVSDEPTNAQQISFTVGSLTDLQDIYRAIKAEGCQIEKIVNHGIAFGCYFRDIENNILEVYWSTGLDYPQPAGIPVDLGAEEADLMNTLDEMPAAASPTQQYYGRDVGKRLVS